MNNEVISVITITLEKEFHLRKSEQGYYEDEIYTDYRDVMEKDSIEEILSNEFPRDRFNDLISDWYCDTEFEMISDYLGSIANNLEDLEIEYDADDIRDYLYENVCILFPYEHFENQKVCANLVLDTGDANFDFGLNSDYNYGYARDENFEFDPCSSLLWLANQQGYTKNQLEAAINSDECINSDFLGSVVQEVSETTSSMNTITFFIDTTLGDLLKFSEEPTGLIVSKDTNCGLIDYWHGAGGPLDIILEKDVLVPKECIDSFTIDGNRGQYSADSIYGLCESHWNGTATTL